MDLVFDVCCYFETGRDFSFGDNPNGYSTRSVLTNTQCHAQEDGEVCTRNGRCVIARTEAWDRITKKTWSKKNISKKQDTEERELIVCPECGCSVWIPDDNRMLCDNCDYSYVE